MITPLPLLFCHCVRYFLGNIGGIYFCRSLYFNLQLLSMFLKSIFTKQYVHSETCNYFAQPKERGKTNWWHPHWKVALGLSKPILHVIINPFWKEMNDSGGYGVDAESMNFPNLFSLWVIASCIQVCHSHYLLSTTLLLPEVKVRLVVRKSTVSMWNMRGMDSSFWEKIFLKRTNLASCCV